MKLPLRSNCVVKKCCNKIRSNNSCYCEKHYYRLRRTGTIDLPSKKYTVNENAFKKLTKQEAWVLGLIWADGNIRGNRVTITSCDLEMLEIAEKIIRAKNCIQSRKKIKNRKQAYDLVFSNKIIATRLRDYGLIENKSRIIKWPLICDDLRWDFIRGVFDGDGCICVSKDKIPSMTFNIVTASEEFFDVLVSKIKQVNIDISLNQKKLKNGFIYRLVGGHKACVKFFHIIYEDKKAPFLQRKFDKFKYTMSFERNVCGRPKGTPSPTRCSTGLEKMVIDDYLNVSKTVNKTGLKFNLDGNTVLNVLKRNGISRFSGRNQLQRMSINIRNSIIKDRKNGATFMELTDKYEVGRNNLRVILKNQ